MKAIERYKKWCATWSKSQVVFTVIITLIPTILAVWAASKL